MYLLTLIGVVLDSNGTNSNEENSTNQVNEQLCNSPAQGYPRLSSLLLVSIYVLSLC